MNKKYIVSLTEGEPFMLKEKISNRSPKSSVVLNSQILLAADVNGANLTGAKIAEAYHLSPVTVQRVREKFVLYGIETALNGLPRRPHNTAIKIDGDLETHLTQLACGCSPTRQWS